MFKKKLRNYDDPRDTHGFYEQFYHPISTAEFVEFLFRVATVAAAGTILWIAFA
jgi:hypothetical protein